MAWILWLKRFGEHSKQQLCKKKNPRVAKYYKRTLHTQTEDIFFIKDKQKDLTATV